jgi:hypothetical protein
MRSERDRERERERECKVGGLELEIVALSDRITVSSVFMDTFSPNFVCVL